MPVGRRLWRAPWGSYRLALLSFIPLGLVIALRNSKPEGACIGIGFGCSFYSWQISLINGVIFGVPFLLGLALLVWIAGGIAPAVGQIAGLAGLVALWYVVFFVPDILIRS